MSRKMEDIKTILSQNKLHIFGLKEAHVSRRQDMTNYTRILASALTYLASSAVWLAVFTHLSIRVKKTLDLKANDLQLEARLSGRKKSLFMVAYCL